MTGTQATKRSSADWLASGAGLLRAYGSALSGSAGRILFSLAYFVMLANVLPIGDFGLFATASATGVVLSRLLAFGFVSPLYRTATVRPRLIGVYTGGFLVLAVASLPLVALAGLVLHALFFADDLALAPFAVLIAAEVVLWRPCEVIIIVNNGMGRFGRAALMTIAGTAFRAVAAGIFIVAGGSGLAQWSWYYAAANAVALLIAGAWLYPGHRLRLQFPLYMRKLGDALAVCGAEVTFYVQSELDKLLVLAMGGAHFAGIYAIVMRLADLTAIPIRAFSMMLVQALMRRAGLLDRIRVRAAIEAGILVLSTAAFLALALILHYFPRLLGENVSVAVPYLLAVLAVPALRNLVEYHAELLYARGLSLRRTINLVVLAAIKAGLLALALAMADAPEAVMTWLNGVFAALYLSSALMTYTAMRRPAVRL